MLPLVTLASCSSNSGSDVIGHEKFLVDRSGDLLVSSPSTYATIGNQRSYQQMIEAMDKGETVLFTFASYNCTHCHNLEPAYISYMRDVKPNMYIYYYSDGSTSATAQYTETIETLAAYYGIYKLNDNPFRWTPTIFIGNKDAYYQIETNGTTQQYLENSIKNHTDFSNLYYFSSFENYLETDSSSILTILYSQESDTDNLFHDSFYDLAHNSSKVTYLLDYDTMSEEEQSQALKHFGIDSYSLSFSLNGETIKEEDALSYYGASSNDNGLSA